MKRFAQIWSFSLLALSVAMPVYAVSTDFTIRTLVGTDTTPPSVPTGLVATPVATSQINLGWNASTDDFELSGYQVFRDGLQIATTTLTSYSDVGLTASTTYTYTVTAFDTFNNISASSSPVSTTTLSTPVVPPSESDEGGRNDGTRVRLPGLVSLQVIPSQYGARIRYETDGYVRSIVRWGTSISYELGSSAERSFSRSHEISIDELTPGTRYEFSIRGEDQRNRSGILTESYFVTLPYDDITAPGVVTGFIASEFGSDVKLSWQNPSDSDFSHVRILRSETFFPSNLDEGWLVYEGREEGATDNDVVAEKEKSVFYTIFAYDERGNISSGAVTSLRFGDDPNDDADTEIVDESENVIALSFTDVAFYQDNELLPSKDSRVHIDGGKHLTIALPYNRLPEHLKTILVSIVPLHDTEKVLRFLLHVNKDMTAYTARLAPIGVTGDFSVRVSVFDYKTARVGYTEGYITSIIQNYQEEVEADEGMQKYSKVLYTFVLNNYVWIFMFFLILLSFLARKLLTVSK